MKAITVNTTTGKPTYVARVEITPEPRTLRIVPAPRLPDEITEGQAAAIRKAASERRASHGGLLIALGGDSVAAARAAVLGDELQRAEQAAKSAHEERERVLDELAHAERGRAAAAAEAEELRMRLAECRDALAKTEGERDSARIELQSVTAELERVRGELDKAAAKKGGK